MSYSVGFTSKSVKIREKEGLSIKQTAQRFHLGTTSITRWLKRVLSRLLVLHVGVK
ncbi:hypothetical protein [Candidatus Hamiltonella defensa]|uniref:hypothetical protein n=1 Tax=Candidatus Williamhamiltonella defendens TaxID=138072 RepID=UPI001582965D|nr:hypothetical protein [Candidatus Hamiltonella defensa]